MIHELSVSPFAGTATVFLVGDCHGSPTNDLDRVHRFGSWDRVADTVLAWAHQTRDVLAAHRWPTPAVGRSDGERSDDLAPMVVVLDGEPDDERFAALCTTIADAIVPVVVVGVGTNIDAATDVLVADGHLSIPRLGLTCAAQTISAETAEQVVELLDDSERIPEQLELVEETANEHPREQPRVGEPYLDPPFDVLVRVLGEIEVLGAEHPLTPMQTSVFVYLALHSPVASETIQDAIWTMPTENRKKRLANTISEIRPSIGPDQLPPASDGKYRVGPGVKTDLELFESRVAHAAEQPAELAMETLRGALELVSGPVFTYRNSDRTSYVWVDHENWISSTELKVTCTAERLACLYLVAGDHDGAVWAASVGLKAAPTHSRLTEVLMRAHHAAGDRAGLQQPRQRSSEARHRRGGSRPSRYLRRSPRRSAHGGRVRPRGELGAMVAGACRRQRLRHIRDGISEQTDERGGTGRHPHRQPCTPGSMAKNDPISTGSNSLPPGITARAPQWRGSGRRGRRALGSRPRHGMRWR